MLFYSINPAKVVITARLGIIIPLHSVWCYWETLNVIIMKFLRFRIIYFERLKSKVIFVSTLVPLPIEVHLGHSQSDGAFL